MQGLIINEVEMKNYIEKSGRTEFYDELLASTKAVKREYRPYGILVD